MVVSNACPAPVPARRLFELSRSDLEAPVTDEMIHADVHLARRLEAIICVEWRRLAETTREGWPEKGATYLDVADGVALWLGEGSPVNVAVGLGMEGPVEEAHLRQVEDFYARRGATPILATCPFADPSLFALLAKRGWQITEFENVLALRLGAAEPSAPGRRRRRPVAGARPGSPRCRPAST